jgi:UTP-glucose-1-phosphate uridylyltransferase
VQRVRREFREREDAFQYYRDAQLNINLWCDTEDEREHISQQIMNRFYEEQTEHIRVGDDSLTTKHGLIHGTVNIEESFQMDELAEHPPLLRSVFRVEGVYITEFVVREDSFEDIEYEIELNE